MLEDPNPNLNCNTRVVEPHLRCNVTKDDLMELNLKVTNDCPICFQLHVLCSVGLHPSKPLSIENKIEKNDTAGIWLIPPSIRNLFGDQNKLVIRGCFHPLKLACLSNMNIILKGKAGRGKSIFILYWIIDILYNAKYVNRDEDPVIVFIYRSTSECYLMKKSSIEKIPYDIAIVATCDYYFSDNVDLTSSPNKGSVLTLIATSGDENTIPEFHKRVQECNGLILFLPSFTYEEILLRFSETSSEEENKLKFQIVGGNPRVYSKIRFDAIDKSLSYYGIVYTAVTEYITENEKIRQWAVDLIVETLNKVNNPINPKVDSSLFMEYHESSTFSHPKQQFATTFMGLLTAKLLEPEEANLKNSLRRLLGGSGLGFAYEYTAHVNIFNSSQENYSCFSENRSNYTEFSIGGKRRVWIRNVDDIKDLRYGDYGLPIHCNFPTADAIVPPNIILQMTIGNTHKELSASILKKIADQLKINMKNLIVIFIVPKDNIKSFNFPISSIKQYISSDIPFANESVLENIIRK